MAACQPELLSPCWHSGNGVMSDLCVPSATPLRLRLRVSLRPGVNEVPPSQTAAAWTCGDEARPAGTEAFGAPKLFPSITL